MKFRNPIYLPFALAACLYLALANHNGWSLLHSVFPKTWGHRDPATRHK